MAQALIALTRRKLLYRVRDQDCIILCRRPHAWPQRHPILVALAVLTLIHGMSDRHDRLCLLDGTIDRSLFVSCTVSRSQRRFAFQKFVRQLLLPYQALDYICQESFVPQHNDPDIAKETVFGLSRPDQQLRVRARGSLWKMRVKGLHILQEKASIRFFGPVHRWPPKHERIFECVNEIGQQTLESSSPDAVEHSDTSRLKERAERLARHATVNSYDTVNEATLRAWVEPIVFERPVNEMIWCVNRSSSHYIADFF